MTEMAVPEATDNPPVLALDSSPLAIWADSARRASAVAVSLAKTPFVPQSLREKPANNTAEAIAYANGVTAANITAAILTGQEIGIQPMAALRSIDVIQGTPAMRAHALRGLVQSRGHKVWVESATVTRAVVKGQRLGEEHVQQSVWDMERARGLGLVSKDNWRKQPMAMLVARATSELCRLIASDVLIGLPYSVEELSDDGAVEATEAPATAVRRTARRRTVEAVPFEGEPSLEAPQPELPTTVVEGDQEFPEPPADWEPTP